jgi:hypothetical protein
MRIVALLATASLFVAAPAAAEQWDFILTNSTGKAIKAIALGANGGEPWVEDKIDPEQPKKELKNGGRTTVHFEKDAAQCRFAIKATFADDTSAISGSVNLCDNSYVTIRATPDGKLTASAS